jgi:hypothetical protein
MNLMLVYFLLFILFILLILLSLYILISFLFIYYDIKNKVFFAPSEKRIIEEFFKIYPFEKDKIFFDLGSGDGRVVFLAEEKGMKAYGVENNLILYLFSKILKKIKKSKANFIRSDLRKIDLKECDYIYLYLLPKFLEEIEEEIFEKISPKTKIISYKFKFPNKKVKEVYLDKFFIYEKNF